MTARGAAPRAVKSTARREEFWTDEKEGTAGTPMGLLAVQFDRLRTEMARDLKAARAALGRARTPGGREAARAAVTAAQLRQDAACERVGRALEDLLAEQITAGRARRRKVTHSG